MAKAQKAPTEVIVKSLLEKHACPVPFHEVRTRFLGCIATPVLTASPVIAVRGLWGGDWPIFDSLDEANELIGALVQGLWNDLTLHQKRSHPFRLTRLSMPPSMANMVQYSSIRRQELDGFLMGIFNGEEEIDLPRRAHDAIGHLDELRVMMESVREFASRDPNEDGGKEVENTFDQLRGLTRIMELEVNEAVLSCARARRQPLDLLPTSSSTVH